jgi:hypothetical protein
MQEHLTTPSGWDMMHIGFIVALDDLACYGSGAIYDNQGR